LGSDVTPIPVVFNQDIKLTQHGPLTILRDGPMGTASEYHDATARWTVAFDEIGRFIGRELILGGTVVYHLDVELDEASRVTGMTETLNGVALEWGFAYDQQDRLVETSRDGVVTETYTYDDRGNRLSWWTAEHGAQTATYDLSDRLLFLGDEAQVFNADGQCTQVRGLELTYATRGELLQSSVAGQQWQYAYDLIGRQVMRQGAGGARTVLFGPIASPWLPAGARLEDGTELLFFYDELGTLLRIHRDGVPYYVASDQVGTPRAVFDQAGTLVKEISRDSFGNILSDSNDAWDMVLGFAGGVEDPATGLIRFGLRDYDPVTGRFLTLDPLLFNVPQTHLYAYSRNTPQTRRDPSGLLCVGLGMFNVVGVAGEICLDDDGISACGEAGVGWGSGWDLDFFGGLQDTDWGVEVEASADFLGAGGEAKFNVSRCKGMRQSYDFGGPGNRMGFESQYDPNSEEWGDWDPGYSADLKQATDSMDKIDSVIDHFTKGGSGKKGLKMGAGGHVSATLKACAQLGW
jgi:RHS repeat-associated protein